MNGFSLRSKFETDLPALLDELLILWPAGVEFFVFVERGPSVDIMSFELLLLAELPRPRNDEESRYEEPTESLSVRDLVCSSHSET
jgi:hypothetical protein